MSDQSAQSNDGSSGKRAIPLLGAAPKLLTFVPEDAKSLQAMTVVRHEVATEVVAALRRDPVWSTIWTDLNHAEINAKTLDEASWSTDDASKDYQTTLLSNLQTMRDVLSSPGHYWYDSLSEDAQMYMRCTVAYLSWFEDSFDARRSLGIARPQRLDEDYTSRGRDPSFQPPLDVFPSEEACSSPSCETDVLGSDLGAGAPIDGSGQAAPRPDDEDDLERRMRSVERACSDLSEQMKSVQEVQMLLVTRFGELSTTLHDFLASMTPPGHFVNTNSLRRYVLLSRRSVQFDTFLMDD